MMFRAKVVRALISALCLSGILAIPSPASAQDIIATYSAMLSRNDMFNSRGTRLTDLCAIVQQDRANYHRFGLRDQLDQADPIFSNRTSRAAISGRCRVAPEFGYIPRDLARGEPRFVYIVVYGGGGRVTDIVVMEGAG